MWTASTRIVTAFGAQCEPTSAWQRSQLRRGPRKAKTGASPPRCLARPYPRGPARLTPCELKTAWVVVRKLAKGGVRKGCWPIRARRLDHSRTAALRGKLRPAPRATAGEIRLEPDIRLPTPLADLRRKLPEHVLVNAIATIRKSTK